MSTWSEQFKQAADALAAELDADVVVYNGRIERPSDDKIIKALLARRRRKNVFLLLVTLGGDSHAAYRIARYLQAAYARVILFVPGECKSSGTLVAVAAHELVMGPLAELGPLDVQMDKKGELWDLQSGLTVDSALTSLQEKAMAAFEHFLVECRLNKMPTQLSADVAVKLASNLFGGIFSQIEPMHVGEAARSITIATRYGDRLQVKSENLEEGALARLISSYPAHGFVIDATEAGEMFKRIREPSTSEQGIADHLGSWATRQIASGSRREPFFWIASSEIPEPPNTGVESEADSTTEESDASHEHERSEAEQSSSTATAGNGHAAAAGAEGATDDASVARPA